MRYKKSRGRIKRNFEKEAGIEDFNCVRIGAWQFAYAGNYDEKIVSDLGVSDVVIEHTDLSSAKGMKADLYVGTRDIATQFQNFAGETLALDNMLDKKYIAQKLFEKLREMNVIESKAQNESF